MRKAFAIILNFIAKAIASIFAILFVITAVLVLLLLNFEHTLLNAETYKRALLANKLYEQAPALVGVQFSTLKDFLANPCAENPLGCAIEGASPELQACLTNALGGQEVYEAIGKGLRKPTEAELSASQPCLERYGNAEGPQAGGAESMGGPAAFTQNLNAKDWQTLIGMLLPPDELRWMSEATLDQVFAYLNGDSDSAQVPLVKLKAHLSGQAGKDLILLLLNAQPPCSAEQQAQILAGDIGKEGEPTLLCSASGATRNSLVTQLQKQLDKVAAGIPDQAVIIKPPSASDISGQTGPFGNDPQTALRTTRLAIRLSPLLPLTLLLLVTLFGVRSRKGWLRWWGIPLLIAGLIAAGFGIAALPVLDWAWVNILAAKIPPMYSHELASSGYSLARAVLGELAIWVGLSAGLIALLGLGAIVASSRLKPKHAQAAPTTDTPEQPSNNVGPTT